MPRATLVRDKSEEDRLVVGMRGYERGERAVARLVVLVTGWYWRA